MMPGMDGNETTRVIRRMPQFADLPIVFLTAQALAEQREQSVEAGASAYLTKPVDLDLLLDTMSHWIGADGSKRGGAHGAAPAGPGVESGRDNGEPTSGGNA
jgi:CheY-like chemotaxis protein